jgi:hypothetical protein
MEQGGTAKKLGGLQDKEYPLIQSGSSNLKPKALNPQFFSLGKNNKDEVSPWSIDGGKPS